MTEPKAQTATPRKLVFIADDYDHLAEMLSVLIQHEALCETIGMKDGADVLARAADRRPDICILDIDMPIVGGMEAARSLRTSFSNKCPLLIAMTGRRALDPIRHSRLFDHVLPKPLHMPSLLLLLRGEAPGR